LGKLKPAFMVRLTNMGGPAGYRTVLMPPFLHFPLRACPLAVR